jgi:hypothetical protein
MVTGELTAAEISSWTRRSNDDSAPARQGRRRDFRRPYVRSPLGNARWRRATRARNEVLKAFRLE